MIQQAKGGAASWRFLFRLHFTHDMSPFGHIGPEPDLVAENRSDNYLSLLAMQALRVAARRGTRPAVAGLPTTVTRTYATPVPYGKQEADPQLAGYPELPYESKQRRSAFGWDDWQMRRNFGETVRPPRPRRSWLC